MNVYKLRAECRHDVGQMMKFIPFEKLTITAIKLDGDFDIPDVEVEFTCADSLSVIIDKLRRIPDGHVMVETVNLKGAYSRERLDR